MTLPAYTDRLYAGDADRRAMIELLVDARPVARLADYPSAADLAELLELPDVRANTRVWPAADGRLAGFAVVDPNLRNLLFEIAPRAIGSDVESRMIAWGVERIRHVRPDAGAPLTLDTCCADDDDARLALLARQGFVAQAERTLRLFRPLDAPIPEPHAPTGFSVSCVAGEDDVMRYVALHRAAFGTQNMTIAHRLAIMRSPDYDPALDLIAVAPDGTWAAFCVCHIFGAENAATGRNDGWADPIGTHPDYRRRGLARALLLTGLRLLRERGVDTALLGTLNTNVPMLRLAESVGFRARSTTMWLSKPVAEA